MLKIHTKHIGEVTLVKFSGEIDYSNFKNMRDHLSSMLTKGRTKLIVDLEGINFLDSSGLGALVSLSVKTRKKKGDLKLIGVNNHVLKLLEMTRLIQVLDLYKTEEEAILSFGVSVQPLSHQGTVETNCP